jgi:hypothetical protein
LQDKECISAYLFSLGLDDQIKILPSGVMPSCRILWFLRLTVHRTARRRRGKRRRRRRRMSSEEEEVEQPICRTHLVVPDPDYASDSEEEEGQEQEEEEEEHQQHQLSPPFDDTPRKRSRR